MGETLTLEATSERELQAIARYIVASYPNHKKFALFGDLGSGKTAIVKAFAAHLGIEEYIDSPTFTIMNVYEAETDFVHFDLYRLEDAEEIFDLGYEEYFYGEEYVFVEWAEKLGSMLPDFFMQIWINVDPSTQKRTFKIM